MRIRLAGLGGALVLVATLLTGTAAPAGSAESVPGLRDRATVVRDRFGVNHVIARNDHDLFFLQGWVHARDRLFQMDLSRRQASGRRAELLGTDVLADDIQIHGGIGFTWEHPAHLYFKRAKSSELLFGDPTYHRELLAQRIGI